MSDKAKSIASKKTSGQDERLKEVSKLRLLLNRPELGAVGGAILVFIFFGIVAGDTGMFSAYGTCLLYTSPSPRDPKTSRMPSSA